MGYMDTVENIILENFNKCDTFFIFPSEITAAFWRMKSLEVVEKNAVRSERFLSWDKFKEKNFSLNQKGTPVNRVIRTLFSISLLEENSSGESLITYLIPPGYAENSTAFKKLLLSILPRLSGILKKVSDEMITLPHGLRKDLNSINIRYKDFLHEKGLFEPGWMQADISALEGQYFLFFPEVIEDYDDFSGELTGSERIVTVPAVKSSSGRIIRFPSSSMEIKWLLNKIDTLLNRGVPPENIAITLPDMEGWRYHLETMATIRDIPLIFKEGRSISEYPGAKFFQLISDCIKTGFSSTSMKNLLMNGAIPWQRRDLAEKLVSFGIEHHCFRNYHYEGKEKDLWSSALKITGEQDLTKFYMDFKRAVLAVSRAQTFETLKNEIQKFITLFLDTENMESCSTLKEFQFALESLNGLIDAAEKCGNLSIPSPFSVWLSVMDDTVYVPRSENTGVAVYPYRVAAGIDVPWHFIPGYSQRVSAVIKESYPFLREDQKESFPENETDFTDAFSGLYMESGENVIFSMSDESFTGPEIPPSDFVNREAVNDFTGCVSDIGDVFDLEKAFWDGRVSSFAPVVPVMEKGFNWAEISVFNEKLIDYTRQSIKDAVLRKNVYNKITHDSTEFEVSSTMLDTFYFCPYSFFLRKALLIESDYYETFFKDHPLIGTLIHECFKDLFLLIDESTAVFDSTAQEQYKEKIPSLVDRILRKYLREGHSLLSPVWEEIRFFITEHLCTFIGVEAGTFPDFSLESVERNFYASLEQNSIILKGRIDRISVYEDQRCLVDYKKKYKVSLAGLNPADALPESFQLFFYILLAETEGKPISSASYYDFTGDRYVTVFSEQQGRKMLSREDVTYRIEEMKECIYTMKERIEKGDFTADSCNSCSFRNICRVKYTVR